MVLRDRQPVGIGEFFLRVKRSVCSFCLRSRSAIFSSAKGLAALIKPLKSYSFVSLSPTLVVR